MPRSFTLHSDEVLDALQEPYNLDFARDFRGFLLPGALPAPRPGHKNIEIHMQNQGLMAPADLRSGERSSNIAVEPKAL